MIKVLQELHFTNMVARLHTAKGTTNMFSDCLEKISDLKETGQDSKRVQVMVESQSDDM